MKLFEIDAQGNSRIVQHTPDWVRQLCAATAQRYATSGFVRPWTGYLAETTHAVVGTCAFKGPPRNNEVEIEVFTFPDFEGEGFATEMVRQLIDTARGAQPGIVLLARTLTEPNPASSVLKKTGFRLRTLLDDPEDGPQQLWELPPSN